MLKKLMILPAIALCMGFGFQSQPANAVAAAELATFENIGIFGGNSVVSCSGTCNITTPGSTRQPVIGQCVMTICKRNGDVETCQTTGEKPRKQFCRSKEAKEAANDDVKCSAFINRPAPLTDLACPDICKRGFKPERDCISLGGPNVLTVAPFQHNQSGNTD